MYSVQVCKNVLCIREREIRVRGKTFSRWQEQDRSSCLNLTLPHEDELDDWEPSTDVIRMKKHD